MADKETASAKCRSAKGFLPKGRGTVLKTGQAKIPSKVQGEGEGREAKIVWA
jgi:hypothetical protein